MKTRIAIIAALLAAVVLVFVYAPAPEKTPKSPSYLPQR